MIQYIRLWAELRGDKRAVTAVEYAILASLIAVGLVTAVTTLMGGMNSGFANIALLLKTAPTSK